MILNYIDNYSKKTLYAKFINHQYEYVNELEVLATFWFFRFVIVYHITLGQHSK